MTITAAQVFWLVFTSVLAGVALELRKQKILKTLAANLVTTQIKNEDTAAKLVEVCTRLTAIQGAYLSVVQNSDQNRLAVEALAGLLASTKTRLQNVEDKIEQNQIVLTNQITTEVEAAEKRLAATPAGGSILDQLQSLNVEQILDLAKKSGATLEKVGPILDVLGKLRNGAAAKN